MPGTELTKPVEGFGWQARDDARLSKVRGVGRRMLLVEPSPKSREAQTESKITQSKIKAGLSQGKAWLQRPTA